MARDQKAKASQAQKKAKPNQSVASNTTQNSLDATSTIPAEQPTLDNSSAPTTANILSTTDTASTSSNVSQEQATATIQSAKTSDQKVAWPGLQPVWPTWPTSKPGPHSTPPAPGTRPINKLRPEQFAEIGYNQQTGESATQDPLRSLPDEHTTGPTGFDQPTAQDVLGKRKQRL